MKKLLTILLGAFMAVAAYGQYPEVEELDDGATFGEQRTKINDDIRLDNQQSDSLVAHLVRLEGIGDSLAVHNLIIWNNTDAIAGQKDDITDLTADVDANTGNISTNGTNISSNSVAISARLPITDTSAMLEPYALSSELAESSAWHVDGERVGPATAPWVDSIMLTSSMLTGYVGGVREGYFNDSIDILKNALIAAEYRLSVLEGADVTPPALDSAFIKHDNDTTIYMLFNEELNDEDNTYVNDAFSYTFGTEDGAIDSVTISASYVIAHSSISVPIDSVVRISYVQPEIGGIQDFNANYTYSFSNQLVFNGGIRSEPFVAQAAYFFNNNLFNEYSAANDGVAIGGEATYLNDTSWINTTSNGNKAVEIPDIIDGDHAITFWAWLPAGVPGPDIVYLFSNIDGPSTEGFRIYFDSDGSDGFSTRYYVVDSELDAAYAEDPSYGFSAATWHHVAINVDVDKGDGTAQADIYIDGVHVNPSDNDLASSFTAPVTVSGRTNYIGSSTAPANGVRDGGNIGEFILYHDMLTITQIDSSYHTGGNRLWYTESIPSSPGGYEDTTYTIYEEINFDATATGEIPNETMRSWFDGNVYDDGNDEEIVIDDVTWVKKDLMQEIVDFDSNGDHAFEHTILQGAYNLRTGAIGGADYYYSRIRAFFPSSFRDLANDNENQEVWFSYNLWFDPDWYWDAGKMLGLNIGPLDGSGATQDGGVFPWHCTAPPDDWTGTQEEWENVRYDRDEGSSWRMHWGYNNTTKSDELASYAYYYNWKENSCKNKTYGSNMSNISPYSSPHPYESKDDFARGYKGVPLGEWCNITIRFVENTVNTNLSDVVDNGLVEYYFNHELVWKATGLRMRYYKEQHLDAYYIIFTTGGSQGNPLRTEDMKVFSDDWTLWDFTNDASSASGNISNPIGFKIKPPNSKYVE